MTSDKKVLLHAGFAKTGTTSLQCLLAGRRTGLARAGIVYPVNDIACLPAQVNHPGLSFAWMQTLPQNRQVVDRAQCRAWLTGVLDRYRASSHELLLMSHETLSEASRNMDWTPLRRLLSPFDVTVLVYVRVLDQYVESRLEQMIRSGNHSLAKMRSTARALGLGRFSFLRQLEALKEGLGARVIVRSFDAALQGDGLEADFERQAGLPPGFLQGDQDEDTESRRNVSLLPAHRLFLAHLAGSSLPPENARALRHVLRGLRGGEPPLAGRGFGLLPPAQKKRARRRYNREIPRINRLFGCDIEAAPALTRTELDYATRLTRTEFDAIADSLEGLLDTASLARVRAAYQP